MFGVNTDNIQYLFDATGETVLINDVPVNAIITNPRLSENEERHIHTLDKVKQGDLVSFDDENFLIVSETITKRYGKYKSIIRHCNYVIEITGEIEQELKGYDQLGRPVYGNKETPLLDENGDIVYNDYGEIIYVPVYADPSYIPAIIDNQSFAVMEGVIRIGSNEIVVTVQDNEDNRTKFAVNNEFNCMGKSWKVLNQDRTKKGLLVLTCEMTA